jgi:Zn-dependent protease/predicted transcriptional regulator
MFKNRLHIGTCAGINIGVDASWIIIAILLSWSLAENYFPYYFPSLSIATCWFMGIVGMLGFFVCILLHELGHSLVAKSLSVPVSQITLFVFGGIAEIKKDPPSPKAEFLISIAGPIVSIIIVAVMYFLTALGDQAGWPLAVRGITGYLAMVNFVLVLFNMIPAMPLDGGRVLRAFLWWLQGNLSWATRITSALGIGFSIFLLCFGFLVVLGGDFISGVWLVVLGFFLYNAAFLTRVQMRVGTDFAGQKVSRFMTQDPISIPPDSTIENFIEEYVYHYFHHLYPVTQEGALIGYMSTKEVRLLPKSAWKTTLVRQAMVPAEQFPTVTPETEVLDAIALMHKADTPSLMVEDGGKLVGMITTHNLLRFLSLKSELEE